MTHSTHKEELHAGTARGLHHLTGRLRGRGGLARMVGSGRTRVSRLARPAAGTRLHDDVAASIVVAQHPADQRRCGRGGGGDEAGRHRPDAHPRQPDPVPVAPRGRPGGPFPCGRLPRSPGAPAATASTTGTPMSPSRWLPAERSTADSSCSSTSPRCSPVYPARTPFPDRALLSEPRDVRVGMTLAGNPLHEDDTALTFAGLLGEVIRAWRRVELARRRARPLHDPPLDERGRCRVGRARRRKRVPRPGVARGLRRRGGAVRFRGGSVEASPTPRSLPDLSTRRRTAIEPARELVAPSSVLKTAEPTRNPDASA